MFHESCLSPCSPSCLPRPVPFHGMDRPLLPHCESGTGWLWNFCSKKKTSGHFYFNHFGVLTDVQKDLIYKNSEFPINVILRCAMLKPQVPMQCQQLLLQVGLFGSKRLCSLCARTGDTHPEAIWCLLCGLLWRQDSGAFAECVSLLRHQFNKHCMSVVWHTFNQIDSKSEAFKRTTLSAFLPPERPFPRKHMYTLCPLPIDICDPRGGCQCVQNWNRLCQVIDCDCDLFQAHSTLPLPRHAA